MSSPEYQHALVVAEYGAPFTVAARKVPIPTEGYFLVRVEAIGLNPAEYKMRGASSWVVKEYLTLLGTDGAGVVVSKAAGTEGVEIGDKIFFQGYPVPDRSVYQEYTLVYANLLAKIPEAISFAQASTIPLALATAAIGLISPYSAGNLGGAEPFWEDGAKGSYRNKLIVVLGGSSAVGQFVIQIASYLGFSPIITTASSHNTELLKSIGATHVIDRNSDVSAALKSIAASVNLIYDVVHTPISQAEIDLLAPGGLIITIWPIPVNGLDFNEGRRSSYFYGSVHMHKELGEEMYSHLEEILEKGIIKPVRVEKLPGGLTAIPHGLDMLEKGEVSGVKLVVSPSETPAL